MTKEEQNIKVHGFIDDGHWHEYNLKYHPCFYRHCKHCNKDDQCSPNPDYLTMNGIGLIREWLEKEGKWRGFELFIHYDYVKSLIIRFPTTFATECTVNATDIATDPEKFIPKFIEYMEAK